VPGGGAAAGLSAALGVALLLMVVRFSRGKPAHAARERELAAAEDALVALQARALPLAEADARSFTPVADAYRLPQATTAQREARRAAIRAGLMGAMVGPMETLALARDALAAVAPVADCASRSTVSDQAAGSALLRAAAEIAFLNVRVNVRLLEDDRLPPASKETAALSLEDTAGRSPQRSPSVAAQALFDEVGERSAALRALVEARL